ncbi:bifunctional lysine-specific demethylase and histidyl-hydroxylase NO66 isoform X2 [Copidosoma floridanum]|uniref:bifunctional lysine-specific demethylase and histidyl-hydroxylase NO66 isoform X2 n=1 Tax=Copidosoma floridanum TaxID=29053 RepID=UPI000C6F91F0|nr:bifunctional lysine-specific demethylase and histidyl-hydroxylase NO66 isoform X2 [Copidosoma floridanum]
MKMKIKRVVLSNVKTQNNVNHKPKRKITKSKTLRNKSIQRFFSQDCLFEEKLIVEEKKNSSHQFNGAMVNAKNLADRDAQLNFAHAQPLSRKVYHHNPIKDSENTFKWLLGPLTKNDFFKLVMERNSYRIYYSCDNSKEYHEYELQYLEIHPKFIDAIKKIILQFPSFMKVKDLPIKNHNYKVQFVSDLWEKGILVCEKPFF